MFHRTPENMEQTARLQQAKVPAYNLGFWKINIEQTSSFRRLREHYEAHKDCFVEEKRNSYLLSTNPTQPPSLIYEDLEFNATLQNELKPIHEAWCGMELSPTACYGLRMYNSGSYLLSHVDRIATHIISSTLCVCQDLSEPWPFFIEDMNGNSNEIDILSGEMLLYESARLKHGRPYDLEGNFYVGQFIHYKPVESIRDSSQF
jgi:prolyl 4-hydroxylase